MKCPRCKGLGVVPCVPDSDHPFSRTECLACSATGEIASARVALESCAPSKLAEAVDGLYEACHLALGAFEHNWAIDWSILDRALRKAEGLLGVWER